MQTEDHFTIVDMQKFISSIYQWMTFNSDLKFIRNSINHCSSEEYIQSRHELNIAEQEIRVALNQLTQSVERLNFCYQVTKHSIRREREEVKAEQKERRARVEEESKIQKEKKRLERLEKLEKSHEEYI